MASTMQTARGFNHETKTKQGKQKMLKRISLLAVAAITSIGLAGCPKLSPPFDATGSYAGTFSLGVQDTLLVENCDITLDLAQDINALPFQNSKVTGTVTLNLSCTVPTANGKATLQDLLDSLLGDLLSSGPVEVEGVLGPNGTLTLTTPDLLTECPDADCEKLLLIGTGTDTDDDGLMDTYTGLFGGLVDITGAVLPLGGEFDTAVVAD